MLMWYCPVCAKEMPFPSLSNTESNTFLSRNPPVHIAQVILSKKIDKYTILKKFKELNQPFDHTENTAS